MPYRAYGKCTICDKWMTELEAEESQWGVEDPNELVCDGCFKLVFASGRGNLTDTELVSGVKTGHQLIAESLEAQALANTFAPINELIAGYNAS